MSFSGWLLIATVGLLFIGWVKALSDAVRTQYPEDQKRQRRLLSQATALFVGLVGFELLAGLSGVFSRFDRFPPPFAIFFIFNVCLLPVLVAFSRFGTLLARGLSVRALSGVHSFRILAELVIFMAVEEGIAPVQMSFEGYKSLCAVLLSLVELWS